MTEEQQETKCYYCDGHSKCNHIGLYEGEGGYRADDTRFRVICNTCYPLINHQGGRSWSVRFTYDNISIESQFFHKIIKHITDQDTDEEEECQRANRICFSNDKLFTKDH